MKNYDRFLSLSTSVQILGFIALVVSLIAALILMSTEELGAAIAVAMCGMIRLLMCLVLAGFMKLAVDASETS